MADMEGLEESWMDPEGGREDPPVPSGTLGQAYPGMGRDAQTDARTMTEAAGQMSDELDMSGWQCDTHPENIADEIRQKGWRNINAPEGGTPAPATTSGGRGGEDVGKI